MWYSWLLLLKLWLILDHYSVIFLKINNCKTGKLFKHYKNNQLQIFGERLTKTEPSYCRPIEKWFQTKKIYLSLPSSFRSPHFLLSLYRRHSNHRKPSCLIFDQQIKICQLDSELFMWTPLEVAKSANNVRELQSLRLAMTIQMQSQYIAFHIIFSLSRIQFTALQKINY